MTELRVDLSQREVNLLLDTLSRRCENARRRVTQPPSVRAIEIADLQRIQGKLVAAEMVARSEAERDDS